ncbi:major facilitator superfamily domain-containing protein [Trichoderma austrokoningii]
MPGSTESETLLASEPSAHLGQNEESGESIVTETNYATALVVTGLFLGATLASMDVAYNTATYALIGSEFHNLENASWLILTHELIHSIAQPIYGGLSNAYGRKRLTLLAYLVFLVGSSVSSLASSFAQALLGRAILSTGVSGMTILVTFTLSDMVQLRTFALLQSVHSICETAGLVLGGILGSRLAHSNASAWRLWYQVNSGIIFVPLLWILVTMPSLASNRSPTSAQSGNAWSLRGFFAKFDILGAALLVTSVFSLILALELGGSKLGWGSTALMITYLMAISSTVAFIYVEINRPGKALIPLNFLRNKTVGFAIGCNSIAMFGYTASLYQISFFLQAEAYANSNSSNSGLSPLYVGLGLGFLVGGLYVRATGNAMAAVFIASSLTSICYVSLASGFVEIRGILNWAVLALLGASLATTFEGLIVSLLSYSKSVKNDRALLIGMNSVIVSIWGTLGTKTSATIFHPIMSKILRSEIRNDDLADDVISEISESLEALRSFDPSLQKLVITSIRKSYENLHVWIFFLSIAVIIGSRQLRNHI